MFPVTFLLGVLCVNELLTKQYGAEARRVQTWLAWFCLRQTAEAIDNIYRAPHARVAPRRAG